MNMEKLMLRWRAESVGIFLLTSVSLIWGFSFGLIKGQLAGISAELISFFRLLIAWLIFLPFAKSPEFPQKLIPRLIVIGMLQFGAMYLLYIQSFQYLLAWEVALFTIFTPLYLTFFNDLLQRQVNWRFFLAALLAVFALMLLKWQTPDSERFLWGFFLVQGSNLSFAVGQIAYKHVMGVEKASDAAVMHWLYFGGWLLSLFVALPGIGENLKAVSAAQWMVLLYLGIVASGIGFWGWNAGARKVNAGMLAVFNNLKIPLAIIVSLLFFGESASLGKLSLALVILLAAMFTAGRKRELN